MERERSTNWWVRWEDMKWPLPDAIDRIRYKADKYLEANIQTAVLYGWHFRWDYMPYFTLLHDYLATVAEELHARGIKLYDHHSVNLVHRYDTREQMRHVMLHSGPHMPFCPSREAAASWEYKGKRLNDWRMLDVKNGQPLYFPQYAGEGFCHRNPDFKAAYQDYARRLVADTGIDGLMADDAVYYMHLNACGCEHCRAELKRRTGMELPPIEDQQFWGNWDNPVFREWIDLRFDATAEFHRDLRAVLPENFVLCSCGPASATNGAMSSASDARKFLAGCNYTNLELCGNTPPYPRDPVTVNRSMAQHLISASHHQAAAREKGVRCYGTGYGFTEPTANIIWAINKFLDADCHFSTLKPRLGLPDHILDTLPDEFDVVKRAYTFEKDHSFLYEGEMVGQVGVYFSYETRNHTYFGGQATGYPKDFQTTLQTLFRAGISTRTVFTFPEPADLPVVVLPSVLAMTEQELQGMEQYLAAGGKVIVTGPTPIPGCSHSWKLPNRNSTEPEGFFSSIRDGVWTKPAVWTLLPQPECTDEDRWSQPRMGMWYNPRRVEDVKDSLTELCRSYGKALPVTVLDSGNYLTSAMVDAQGITLQLLAEEYDTDIDHRLDEMRFHRSRVNYINSVEPVGVRREIRLQTAAVPKVYTPFNEEGARVETDGAVCTVTLPEKCSYAVIRFE